MKVSNEMARVIRAAVKQQKSSRYNRYAIEQEHVKQFRASAAYKSKFGKLERAIAKAKKTYTSLYERYTESTGLRPEGPNMYDAETFYTVSGISPSSEKEPFTESQVLAELAAAKPDQATKILAKYGIDWS